MNTDKQEIKYPAKLLAPIKKFFESEIIRLKKQRKSVAAGDPFKDGNRTMENSVEEDVDEQLGHMDSEVKVNLISRQIVEFRKALTRMKLGKYGICENCGKMINTERLAIKPETTLCISCEQERES